MSSFHLFNGGNIYLLKNDNTSFAATDNVVEDTIGANNVVAGVKTTIVNEDTGIQADEVSPINSITYESFNEAPYINTEYYNPIHYLHEDLIIQYYVMDKTQEDYFLDKHTKEFLVEIDFAGTIFRRKVKAGNHKINLGKSSKSGVTYFSIQCIDISNNCESAKHYKQLLVVEQDTYTITESQTYTMTEEDLITYSITASTDGVKLTDEQGANNIKGINNMLTDIREQGYRKIIFYNPNGDTDNRYTYYVQPYNSRENPIIIPDGLTVDLNKCKLKQLVSYGNKDKNGSLMLRFEPDSTDCHLINGYVWADYDEHIVDKTSEDYPVENPALFEGEGYNLMYLSGAFNSIENLDVAYGTGYTICAGGNNSYGSNSIRNWDNKYINNDGNEVVSNSDIWTSDYVELNDTMKQYKYLQANPSGGYSGLCGKSNDEIVIYYDENKSFIKKEKIRQYGLSLIPSNAKYVRFTLTSDTKEGITNVTAPGFRIETRNYKACAYYSIKDVNVHDCRTVAYATGIYEHLLIDGGVITNCGQSMPGKGQLTTLAMDVEDGYQHSEALYIKDLTCEVGEKGSTTINLVTTYDVHMYGTNKCNLSAHKTFGLNLHDCTMQGLYLGRKPHMITGFMMVYNANIDGIKTNCSDDNTAPKTFIKNCNITGYINNTQSANTHNTTYLRCKITPLAWSGNYAFVSENVIDCIVNINSNMVCTGQLNIQNSILQGAGTFKTRDNDLNINNSDIYIPISLYGQSDIKIYLNKCKLYNSYYNTEYDYIIKNNCEISI